jgi:hypothetical protein
MNQAGSSGVEWGLDPSDREESVRRRPWHSAAFAVKVVHSMVFLSCAASVLHVFYAGVANRGSRLTNVALVIALGESLVFGCNGMRCPLRTLAESLGADSGQVTDLFLPRWFADRIPLFFTPLLVIGVVALAWHRSEAANRPGVAPPDLRLVP